MDGEAKLQQWARDGVRLLGISVVTEPEIAIRLKVRVVTRLVPGPIVATSDFLVEVESGKIELTRFEMQRIGKADEAFASWMGELYEGKLRRKVSRRGDRVVSQVNKAIRRQMKQGKLRFDPFEMVQHLW